MLDVSFLFSFGRLNFYAYLSFGFSQRRTLMFLGVDCSLCLGGWWNVRLKGGKACCLYSLVLCCRCLYSLVLCCRCFFYSTVACGRCQRCVVVVFCGRFDSGCTCCSRCCGHLCLHCIHNSFHPPCPLLFP